MLPAHALWGTPRPPSLGWVKVHPGSGKQLTASPPPWRKAHEKVRAVLHFSPKLQGEFLGKKSHSRMETRKGLKQQNISSSHVCNCIGHFFDVFFCSFFCHLRPPPPCTGANRKHGQKSLKNHVWWGGVLPPPKLSHAAVSACLSPSLGLAPPPPATYPQPPRLSCPQPKPGQEPLARPGPGSPRRAAQCCSPRPLFFMNQKKPFRGSSQKAQRPARTSAPCP